MVWFVVVRLRLICLLGLTMNKYLGIAKLAVGLLPKVKGMIFSDGKFNLKRALILLVGGAVIGAGVYFLGYDNTAAALDLLDELSDMIGYVE